MTTFGDNPPGSSRIQAISFSVAQWSNKQDKDTKSELAIQWQNVPDTRGQPSRWTVFNGSRWVSTGIDAKPTGNQWHHLIISGSVNEEGQIKYDRLTFNDARNTLDASAGPQLQSSPGEDVTLVVGLTASANGEPFDVYIDNVAVRWAP
jgi:hypothetical protein